ncbi:MAG: hypothetical protein KIG57_08070 [Muribaculaceae bacterium]|nr:hypothetical protein [Muribaculaceae bacterium]
MELPQPTLRGSSLCSCFLQAALQATPSLASCPQYAISDGDLGAAAERGGSNGGGSNGGGGSSGGGNSSGSGDGSGDEGGSDSGGSCGGWRWEAVILCRALLGLWLVLRRE